MIHRQIEAEKRLQQQREKQRYDDMIKREMINLKNFSKDYNI